tara:strand:+ start:1304 stop:1501 length:198 start_codon:yes stop_codon:yes gene_type:complete
MKKLLPVLLLSGCTVIDREQQDCVEFMTYLIPKEECTGGRGVAPQICVIKQAERLFCTRYESSTI